MTVTHKEPVCEMLLNVTVEYTVHKQSLLYLRRCLHSWNVIHYFYWCVCVCARARACMYVCECIYFWPSIHNLFQDIWAHHCRNLNILRKVTTKHCKMRSFITCRLQ